MKLRTLFISITICIMLSACRSANQSELLFTPTTQIAAASPEPSQTPTITPSATSTPRPTATTPPTYTPTPPLKTTKQPLITFSLGGGDGRSEHLYYLGADMPSLILYTDGQIILQEGSWYSPDIENSGYVFEQTVLTTDEMCDFLNSIEKTGFFEVNGTGRLGKEDSIYDFGDFAGESSGGPDYTIQVNGPRPKAVDIYSDYLGFVIDEVAAVYDLLDNYQLNRPELYQPAELLLWIESVEADSTQPTQIWPKDLPPLSELITKMDYEEFSPILVNDSAQTLFPLFDYQLKEVRFKEGSQEYLVTARPLLPHEPIDYSSGSGWFSVFPLPFECNE